MHPLLDTHWEGKADDRKMEEMKEKKIYRERQIRAVNVVSYQLFMRKLLFLHL